MRPFVPPRRAVCGVLCARADTSSCCSCWCGRVVKIKFLAAAGCPGIRGARLRGYACGSVLGWRLRVKLGRPRGPSRRSSGTARRRRCPQISCIRAQSIRVRWGCRLGVHGEERHFTHLAFQRRHRWYLSHLVLRLEPRCFQQSLCVRKLRFGAAVSPYCVSCPSHRVAQTRNVT